MVRTRCRPRVRGWLGKEGLARSEITATSTFEAQWGRRRRELRREILAASRYQD
jgi:hypothetical protein